GVTSAVVKGKKRREKEKKEEEGSGGGDGVNSGNAVPGAQRLKIHDRTIHKRMVTAKALNKLRAKSASDPKMAEWREMSPGAGGSGSVGGGQKNMAARVPGYTKKSN
ncbi:hypothetical protein Agub_g1424, partial [Astrephomene gubernaculifera]